MRETENTALLNYNDGGGLFDKFGLLRSCRNDLCALRIRADELSTTGVIVVDIINRLDALIEGLTKDDDEMKKTLDKLRKQLEEEETEEDG